MLTGIKRIVLIDVESTQNPANGDRSKRVKQARVFTGNVELVGINTAHIGQVQGFLLTHSITIPRVMYRSEKYVFVSDELFEIKMLSKAKQPTEMLLNVQKLDDVEIKKAVEEWIRENL